MSSGTGKTGASLRELQCFEQRGLSEISHSSRGNQTPPETDQYILRQDIRRQGRSVHLIHPFDADYVDHTPKQKETSQLAELCESLDKSLSDRSLISQQFKYDDIKRPIYCPPSTYLLLT